MCLLLAGKWTDSGELMMRSLFLFANRRRDSSVWQGEGHVNPRAEQNRGTSCPKQVARAEGETRPRDPGPGAGRSSLPKPPAAAGETCRRWGVCVQRGGGLSAERQPCAGPRVPCSKSDGVGGASQWPKARAHPVNASPQLVATNNNG